MPMNSWNKEIWSAIIITTSVPHSPMLILSYTELTFLKALAKTSAYPLDPNEISRAMSVLG